MIAEKMKPYVKNNSAIRMMFEEGNRLRAIYGPEALEIQAFPHRIVFVRPLLIW